MIYKFTVSKDTIKADNMHKANSGSSGYYKCQFEFSPEWDSLLKFAVFAVGDTSYTVALTDGICSIPQEITEAPCTAAVGVYGSNSDTDNLIRISTDFTHIIIKEGAYREGYAPNVPQADLWEVYFERAAQEAEQNAINAGNTAAQIASAAFDETLGDISSALDNIIAIQEALIGGDTV